MRITICVWIALASSTLVAQPLHVHPSNGRYFQDKTGNAVLLVGSHTWANFQDITLPGESPFDWNDYLDKMEGYGHNFIRLWVWEQAKVAAWSSAPLKFSPMPYQTVMLEGVEKYDLEKWNEAYFQRLRQRVREAGERGIYVSVMLFQGWSLNKSSIPTADPWPYHPFHPDNNVNGVGKTVVNHNQDEENRGTLHSTKNEDVLRQQERYVRKVVETLNDLDNVLYEIINEGGSIAWQYHMIRYIHQMEEKMPKQHPVGMSHAISITPTMWNDDLLNSPADWIAPADEPLDWKYPNSTYLTNYRTVNQPIDNPKVVVLDTDHLWGCGGDAAWVWKTFLQGGNPIFMDPWYGLPHADTVAIRWLSPCLYPFSHEPYETLRRNMGIVRVLAQKIDLAASQPMPHLASSGYCLANPGISYLVWAPQEQYLTLDLRAEGAYEASWFHPATLASTTPVPLTGGDMVVLKSPFQGDAVLILLPKN